MIHDSSHEPTKLEAISEAEAINEVASRGESSGQLSEEDLASVTGGGRKIGGRVWGGGSRRTPRVRPNLDRNRSRR